ncbi:hypothetical protein T08_15033 [Trichinella sp. T8]|nr:hypothetical protein T08_15033 [Trichinella sp. T8]
MPSETFQPLMQAHTLQKVLLVDVLLSTSMVLSNVLYNHSSFLLYLRINAFMEIAVKSIEFVNAANAEKIQITMLNAVTVSLSDSMVADVIFTELASTTAVKCMRNVDIKRHILMRY